MIHSGIRPRCGSVEGLIVIPRLTNFCELNLIEGFLNLCETACKIRRPSLKTLSLIRVRLGLAAALFLVHIG